MNWSGKDRSEVALNRIWSEHVSACAHSLPSCCHDAASASGTLGRHSTHASTQVEKETAGMVPKTKYTCNPCASIDMNNGLGSRGEPITAPHCACLSHMPLRLTHPCVQPVPFVTEKVGYNTGVGPVEVGNDPDGANPPLGPLHPSHTRCLRAHCFSSPSCMLSLTHVLNATPRLMIVA